MIARILSGTLACVLVPLGTVFTVLGLVAEEEEGFTPVGAALLAAGLALAALLAVLTGRARQRKARRTARTRADVVEAAFKPGVRVGAYLAYDLTVTFPAAGTVSDMVLVIPGTELVDGGTVEVVYDPDEPSNFAPA